MYKSLKLVLIGTLVLGFAQTAHASDISMSIVDANTLGSLTSLGIQTFTPTSTNGANYFASYQTAAPLQLINNLGTLSLSGAQIVSGSASGDYAAPWVTTGTPGQTASAYLSVYNGGNATFTLNGASAFGLNWGSVDATNSVTITLANGNSTTFTGSQLVTLANLEHISLTTVGGPGSDTNWGANGSLNVEFTDNTASAIKSIVLGSGQNSFEVTDVGVSQVPLPAALPMFGAAMVGLGWFSRRRMNAKS